MERLLRIDPDGSAITFLYDDRFGMPELGLMGVKRASDVVFDRETQRWRITYRIPGMVDQGGFATREEAIDHEIQELEYFLEVDPERVKVFMEDA